MQTSREFDSVPLPTISLNNGGSMPAIGLGVMERERGDLSQPAMETALACGYRLLDTAASYGNERDVGRAIASSGLPRAELLVTTKLWLTDFGYEAARSALGSGLISSDPQSC